MRGARRALLAAAALTTLPVGAAAQPLTGDPEAGRTYFKKRCSACHMVGEDARNRIGPELNGIFGRKAGREGDFRYSKNMVRMGNDGLSWTFETLDAYLENPRALVSGTRMSFAGVKDPQDRADVMAYLRAYSDRPQDIPEAEPSVAGLEHVHVPDVEGDADYGEYLSSECTTCHQRDGSATGIPSITGWPAADFAAAMHAYKQKLRPHPVMQMMADRLSDEEIASLAAYFATVE